MYKPTHPNQSFQQLPSSNSKVQSSRNTSGSPVQRLGFQANPCTPQQQKNPIHPHADVEQWKKNMSNLQAKTQTQGDPLDWKSQRIQQQEEEIKFLKFQLDISSQQLKAVQNTLGQVQEQFQQLQSQTDQKGPLQAKVFNTSTFEIVVFQKSIEQLESLKSLLVKRKEKLNNEIDQENLSNSQMIELLKELKLKINVLEEQNQKLKDENNQFQVNYKHIQQSLLLFPKAELVERKTRSKERRNSSEIKQIKLKASPDTTALRSPKKGINH